MVVDDYSREDKMSYDKTQKLIASAGNLLAIGFWNGISYVYADYIYNQMV